MDIAIDHDRRIGAGRFALIAPGVFDQSDDGLAVLLVERPEDAQLTAAGEADADADRVADLTRRLLEDPFYAAEARCLREESAAMPTPHETSSRNWNASPRSAESPVPARPPFAHPEEGGRRPLGMP